MNLMNINHQSPKVNKYRILNINQLSKEELEKNSQNYLQMELTKQKSNKKSPGKEPVLKLQIVNNDKELKLR